MNCQWCANALLGLLMIGTVESHTKIVDLTFTFNSSTVYWPGNPDNNFTVLYRGDNGRFWYESNYFGTAEHGGTHLDSPAHFSQGKWRTHQIPADRLIGPAVVINVASRCNVDPDYRVTVSDLLAWEAKHGQIPKRAIVVMKSGWGEKYPIKSAIFNTSDVDDPATFHFPGFHEDAATWLVENRDVGMMGVDTPSVDYGQSKSFPVHQILGSNNVPAIENVGYLDQIPENGATIFVGVMKLFDGSGGPARIIATFEDNGHPSKASGLHPLVGSFIVMLTGILLVIP